MTRLTDREKKYIEENLDKKDRQIQRDLWDKWKFKITHKPIGNYRKKLQAKKVPKTTQDVPKITKQVPKKVPKRKSFSEQYSKQMKEIASIIKDRTEERKLTEEEVTKVFDFFEYLSRKRFGRKFDRKEILQIFLKLAG